MRSQKRVLGDQRPRAGANFGALAASVLALAIFAIANTEAKAGSFEEGVAAFKAGKYTEAYESWASFHGESHFLRHYNIGIMRLKGYGVDRDDELARKSFSLAAQNGFAPALVNLAIIYEKGLGVGKNPQNALAYLDAAIQSLQRGPCRELAEDRRYSIAARLPHNATESSTKVVDVTLSTASWSRSIVSFGGDCFDSVAFSGGQVLLVDYAIGSEDSAPMTSLSQEKPRLPEVASRPARVPQPPKQLISTEPSKQVAVVSPDLPEPPTFAIHLSSFRRTIGTEIDWKRLQKRFPDLLRDRELMVRSVELQGQGTYFRVLTGPFAEYAIAQELCTKFKAREQYCLAIRLR